MGDLFRLHSVQRVFWVLVFLTKQLTLVGKCADMYHGLTLIFYVVLKYLNIYAFLMAIKRQFKMSFNIQIIWLSKLWCCFICILFFYKLYKFFDRWQLHNFLHRSKLRYKRRKANHLFSWKRCQKYSNIICNYWASCVKFISSSQRFLVTARTWVQLVLFLLVDFLGHFYQLLKCLRRKKSMIGQTKRVKMNWLVW